MGGVGDDVAAEAPAQDDEPYDLGPALRGDADVVELTFSDPSDDDSLFAVYVEVDARRAARGST